MRNPATMHIDSCDTSGILRLIQDENSNAVKAVEAALPAIKRACDALERGMKQGGRLIYIGAGTSGRLGVLDAVECPPTYGVPQDLVVGIIAGGMDRMFLAAENAEDSGENGIRDIKEKQLTKYDTVVGISASGDAPYVAEAMKYAHSAGCTTIGVTSNYGSRLDLESDISIVTDTGAEVITGSTRMKAGTAQKMVLNMLSTTVMIRMGMVYENMMINLRPTNEKLKQRVIRITREITGLDEEKAIKQLQANDWNIRRTVESLK